MEYKPESRFYSPHSIEAFKSVMHSTSSTDSLIYLISWCFSSKMTIRVQKNLLDLYLVTNSIYQLHKVVYQR